MKTMRAKGEREGRLVASDASRKEIPGGGLLRA
jgi:hypothetical protein